uniref:Secreted protein n=1 Tax=Parastrongyloides trichosuri TaxID=131310 RepID=A0A0N4ZW12_PARTI
MFSNNFKGLLLITLCALAFGAPIQNDDYSDIYDGYDDYIDYSGDYEGSGEYRIGKGFMEPIVLASDMPDISGDVGQIGEFFGDDDDEEQAGALKFLY